MEKTRCFNTFLLFLAVTTALSQLTEAQSCQKFKKNETDHFCSPYINYKYYLPSFPTQWLGEELVYGNSYSGILQITFTPPKCQQAFVPYICAQAFPKCDVKDGVATGRPVCRKQCDEVNEACGDYFASVNSPPLDCSNFTTGDSCFTLSTSVKAPEFPFECTFPMSYKATEDSFPCTLQCPLPLYDDPFNTAVKWWIRIVEPIAAFCLTIFFGIMIYQRHFWFKYPILYIVYLTFGELITHGGFLSGTFKGSYPKLGCIDDATAATGNLWLCTFSHWCLYLGMWINIICFAVIATKIFTLVSRAKVPHKLLDGLNHLLIFVAPVVIMIVCQALGMVGYTDGNGVCYFKLVPIGSEASGLVLLVVIVPFFVALAWGYTLLTGTFVILLRRVGMKATLRQSRLALFTVIYGACLYFQLVPATQATTGKQVDKQMAYFGCLASNWVKEQLSRHPQLDYCDLDAAQFNKFFFFYGNLSGTINSTLIIAFFAKYALRNGKRPSHKKSNSSNKITGASPSQPPDPKMWNSEESGGSHSQSVASIATSS
eukprot:TRINITY_DN831_c0_g1_i1.p1 TRINITY_DN831_c0_g1~~TRINITY_DN831_c0_g1_i1.p1  ORF type:complete len:543 (-),score=64.17 TRINITY_DN831_c0_g1_i1:132-1760(-)